MSHSFAGVHTGLLKTNFAATNPIGIPADGPQVRFNSSGVLPIHDPVVFSPLESQTMGVAADLLLKPTASFLNITLYGAGAAVTAAPQIFTPYRKYIKIPTAIGGTTLTFPQADEIIDYLKTLMGDSNVLAGLAWETTVLNTATDATAILTFARPGDLSVSFGGGSVTVDARDTNGGAQTSRRLLIELGQIAPVPSVTVTFL